jgi:anti-sigma regulatory factor (Ser/Thr protein kinase)
VTATVSRAAVPVTPVPPASSLRWHFGAEPTSVSLARGWARTVAGCMLLAERATADDVALVVSELATNALRHVTGDPSGFSVALRPWRRGGVCVEVADGGPGLPRLAAPGASAESGRGLCLVDALAFAWGWYRRPGASSKVVYAYLGPAPDPVADLFPPPDPAPVDGCSACAGLVEARAAARTAHDRSAASDANVLLRRHLAEAHR